MEKNTEVLVIGSGPAGYTSAFRCSDLGLKTTLIESYSRLGGVCLNFGCIPTKALLHISKTLNIFSDLSNNGIIDTNININISKLYSWENKIINRLSFNLSKLALVKRINVIYGVGKFISDNSIIVNDVNNNNIIVKFKYAIIATGSSPIKLSIVNDDSKLWYSNDAVLIKNIPDKLLIIGCGIVGLEVANIYSSFGSIVDVVDISNKIMSMLDIDVVDFFLKSMKNKINIIKNTKIISIENRDNGFLVFMQSPSSDISSKFYSNVLVSIGRYPNTKLLALDKAGVELDDNNFIKVDDQMRTSNSNIYAIGDVVGYPMLAHKGIHEAYVASEVIAGFKHYFNPRIIPCILYTDPELSWVGMTEKDCKKNNIPYQVSLYPWSSSGKSIIINSTKGITKLIFDKRTNKIIGGVIIGANSSELLGELSLAIEMGCDAEDISLTIHAHPTLSESINFSVKMFLGNFTDFINVN
ncbi:dihydrolipoyl dehydrogenase [Candidatus Purcelliella pentastirinorum]|uniref:Dihydrolipoyl dehydrogenase n=1 Tax=Candidatus Purcelliella pentastirinorum TaxID=472834 RepID=A0A346DZR5_9ENTR|nr:dihydrolipoyl dehydrogenase [Candidatus Purcelliella pentastirinorum]AXN02220.1 Dihydrolipoamide dehydrogenase of pyruvate dehydrogenase complex [Candidatus Purcelliella pentastirinorum]WDI78775.1 dihydrolipoyl dehydrogenase [Candidatus Purcelliella pentastirinorum]WDR79909.1 dihydrolipoyl dehydrogenase [Candidatus Purcelliella pentastirinorum]